jgi:hypothetical protein
MIPRRSRESQRTYVERVLRAEGRVATYDVLYGLAYSDGQKCSITRLAAVICDLRGDGWTIETIDDGALAEYRLVTSGASEAWRCVECGDLSFLPVTTVLGGMGEGRCDSCHTRRYFRRAAA